MEIARIRELLAPFLEGNSLDDSQLQIISTYIDILRRWNARVNLTAVRDPDEMVTRHFGESLFLARHLFPDRGVLDSHAGSLPGVMPDSTVAPGLTAGLRPGHVGNSPQGSPPAPRAADLGSGAGFPGIPLKLWRPDLRLTLIESNHKKATFLREIIRSLTLTDIDVFAGRAETLPDASFDLVTMRAVERFEESLAAAAALVRPGGRAGLLIGRSQALSLEALLPHFQWQHGIPVPQSLHRLVVIGRRENQVS
jgi:16S rRNA (guanine527-N7)-methyltransferase